MINCLHGAQRGGGGGLLRNLSDVLELDVAEESQYFYTKTVLESSYKMRSELGGMAPGKPLQE